MSEDRLNDLPTDRKSPTAHPPVDPILQVLVSLVDGFGSDFRLGMTLTVSGAIVSGDLISWQGWVDLLDETHGEKLGGLSQGLREGVAEDPASQEAREPSEFSYIHLTNARFLTDGPAPPLTGIGLFWRGRLTEVSGWSFGNFNNGGALN